jgi:PAS domain-containing protein
LAFERITGYVRDEVVGVGCDRLFGIAGEPKEWDAVREALDHNIEANVTLRCTRKGGGEGVVKLLDWSRKMVR